MNPAIDSFDRFRRRVEERGVGRDLEAEDRTRREQYERDRREELRRRSLVPERYIDSRLYALDCDSNNQEALKAAAAVATTGFVRSVAFYGKVGPGKTTIAASLVNGAVDALIPARMVKAASIFDALHEASKYSSSDSVSDIISDFARTRVLMIDDLGRESLTRRDYITWLGELLDRRWDACRPLIVTSNFPFEQLHERYAALCERAGEPSSTAESIVDRLRGIVPLDSWVHVAGETRR
jgi:DNA replication protein DnaC